MQTQSFEIKCSIFLARKIYFHFGCNGYSILINKLSIDFLFTFNAHLLPADRTSDRIMLYAASKKKKSKSVSRYRTGVQFRLKSKRYYTTRFFFFLTSNKLMSIFIQKMVLDAINITKTYSQREKCCVLNKYILRMRIVMTLINIMQIAYNNCFYISLQLAPSSSFKFSFICVVSICKTDEHKLSLMVFIQCGKKIFFPFICVVHLINTLVYLYGEILINYYY